MKDSINVDFIKAYINANNLNIPNFAKKCGLSFSSLYKLLKKERNPRSETVEKIAKVMKISSIFLYMTSEDMYLYLTYDRKNNR